MKSVAKITEEAYDKLLPVAEKFPKVWTIPYSTVEGLSPAIADSSRFKTIVAPKDVNVILVAPKGPGHILRRQFLEGKGVPSLIGIYQDPGKQSKQIALAWAKGIGAGVRKRMKAALKDIQSGKFAKGWIAEYNGGYKQYNALLKAGENHPIEKVGRRLRALMPWMKKRSVKGVQAAY